MVTPVERTGEFLAALAAHHNPAPNTALVQSPDAATSHEFTHQAIEITRKIAEMRAVLQKCQTRYEDFSLRGMNDAERDEIDAAVAQFLRTEVAQIEQLKKEAMVELEMRKGGSFPAHQLGVVVILNEDLQQVGQMSERLRGVRIKQAIAEKGKGKVQYDARVARELAEETRRKGGPEGGDGAEDYALLEQEFARENASLVNELVETRERVKEAERTVFEIANLNHVFAAKVLEQAREIEVLYDLAVEATNYVDRGNRELRKMRKRGPVLKYALAGLAVFLALMLLLQEWIGRRTWLFL